MGVRGRTIWGSAAAVALAAGVIVPAAPAVADGQSVAVWLTTSDLSSALTQQSSLAFAADSGSNPLTIEIDDERTYQTIVGFGATMTESSAWLLNTKLSSGQRSAVLNNVFGSAGISLDMLRQPMGSTDFIHTIGGYYTYDDVANDTALANFSIAPDQNDIIPMILAAQAVNPDLKVNLTSWSAPAWMKDTDTLMAPAQDGYPGTLESQYYDEYAKYLVMAIQAYEAEGIPVWSTSAQNEPTTGNTYNTMHLSESQSIDFITDYFAPELYAAGLQPRIYAGDTVDFNNWYAPNVWADASARDETEGSSHHGYVGPPSAMGQVHDWFPYKPVYQSELAPYCTDTDFRDVIINGLRNWAETIVSWNVALDTTSGPYHTGAVDICDSASHPGIPILPLVTIDQSTGAATYRQPYYWTGHVSKFVQPGAVRIASTSYSDSSVQTVAFLNPSDGTRVVIAWNRTTGSGSDTIKIRSGSQSFSYALPRGAMATFVWSGGTSGSPHGWGDSVRGTDSATLYAGGLRTGTWTTSSATAAATTSLGAGWNSIYTGSDTRLSDFAASVSVTRNSAGTTVAHPKYGVYACYYDSNNYIQAWIDPSNNEFVTNVRLGGTNYGFSGTQALPGGFNPNTAHTLSWNKSGDTFTFAIDGVAQPSRPAPIPGCQVGLVTEDTTATFSALTVYDRLEWGASRAGNDAANIYGGGVVRGPWTVNDVDSLMSTGVGTGWNSIYGVDGIQSANYTVAAKVRQVKAGVTSAHPKYGIYACYYDDDNYVQAWIDPTNSEFVTHALVGGVDLGWSPTSLPGGFDPETNHTISVTKLGSSFTFTLDGVTQSSRSASISNCQIGLVTEDVAANFREISVS